MGGGPGGTTVVLTLKVPLLNVPDDSCELVTVNEEMTCPSEFLITTLAVETMSAAGIVTVKAPVLAVVATSVPLYVIV